MKKLIIAIIAILFAYYSNSNAQWECRSNLSGHLKPFSESSNLSWAGEIIGSTGYLSNSTISNGMGFLGLDYSKNNHQLYFEGGIKVWSKYDYDLGMNFTQGRPGLREVSYNYLSPDFNLSLGLQQIQLPKYFILNERGWGASASKTLGNFQLGAAVATVTKNVARNGSFCTNCFLYDIVPSRNLPLGNSFGDTNFALLSFQRKRTNKSASNSSSSNEFDEFSEFDNTLDSNTQFLKSYGGLLYTEFGDYYNNSNLFLGLNADFSLFKNATLSTQAIYQNSKNNNAFLYSLGVEKMFEWQSGNLSTFKVNYLGKINIDDNALALPRFSNLFFGEVFRMDAIDMPLLNIAAKHQFIDKKLSLKLQYSQQFNGTNMREADFMVGKYFFNKKLRTTFISGVMNSDELNDWAKLARIELRVFF